MPHEWTTFELQTVFSLMAKGVHIAKAGKRKDDVKDLQRNAYVDFATALNEALHGDDYAQDISKKDVTRKIDELLAERKHVVGQDGLLARNRGGRITRSLLLAFRRGKRDFDGSLGEWKNGRKERVMGKNREESGSLPLDGLDKAAGDSEQSTDKTPSGDFEQSTDKTLDSFSGEWASNKCSREEMVPKINPGYDLQKMSLVLMDKKL